MLKKYKKNLKEILGRNGWYFPKLFWNPKISCISTSFKNEIRNLSHIAKQVTGMSFFAKLRVRKIKGL